MRTFIVEGSPSEVNIDSNQRKRCVNNNIDITIFDEAEVSDICALLNKLDRMDPRTLCLLLLYLHLCFFLLYLARAPRDG